MNFRCDEEFVETLIVIRHKLKLKTNIDVIVRAVSLLLLASEDYMNENGDVRMFSEKEHNLVNIKIKN